MLKDVHYAFRVLVRSPQFTAVAVLCLALGIGGATSVFTVLNAVVLRNLPVPNPQQLYVADKHLATEVANRYSWPVFEQARAEVEGRAELFAVTTATAMQIRLPQRTDAEATERGLVQLVSGEFFDVMRQRAQRGRLIAPADNSGVGMRPVAVISDAYWQRRFERSPDIIGRELIIGGTSLSVIGVAESAFFGPYVSMRNPDVWVPLMMQSEIGYAFNASTSENSDGTKPWAPQAGIQWLSIFARIPVANEVAAVQSALTLVHLRDAGSRPDARNTALDRERVILREGARGDSFLRGQLSSRLVVLLAMVGVLVVITCGNVASLLLARASAREREIAIRSAMGANRWRVVRQLLVETLLLSVVGGGLGLVVAAWGRDLLLSMFAGAAAIIDLETSFDWRVLLFVLSVTLACGLAAGILPAIRNTRVAPLDAIKAQARQVGHAGGRRGTMLGKTLVAAQIAFCLLLLVVAGLFVRSMRSLMQADVGFDRDHLLVARLDVRSMGYAPDRRQALYDRVLERVRRIPNVASASLSLNGPLGTSWRISSIAVEGYTPAANEQLSANEEFVTEGYFDTVGLHLVDGRVFTADDHRVGNRNTIINQTMARRFFPGGNALGKRWNYGEAIGPESPVIVGIVQDAKYHDVRGATPNMIYQLAASSPNDVLGNLEVRTSSTPAALSSTLRQALMEAEPALPVFDIMPLDQRLQRGLTNDRLIANLTSAFGGVALLLACLGLYGTISYGVARRVTELGLRMALGATRRSVLSLVVREAFALVAIGAAIGLPLAAVAGHNVVSLLHGVGAVDPVSYALSTTMLLAVASVAAYLPAHRASRIDPMVALRSE